MVWTFQTIHEDAREMMNVSAFLKRWRDTREKTFRLVEAIPDDVLDRQPAEGYRTLRQQAAHLVASELAILDALEHGEFHWKERQKEVESLSMREIIERRLQADRQLAEMLAHHEPGWLEEKVGNSGMSRRGWLQEMVEHEIHHRGILSLSMRIAGIEPPQIYP